MAAGNSDGDGDEDRRAILSRRSKLIALALSGLTTAGTAGCYEAHGRDGTVDAAPVPCLSDSGIPVPCLGAPLEDAGPTPCLEPPYDAGPPPSDAGPPGDAGPGPVMDGGSDSDAGEPVPCLTIIRPPR